MKLIKALVAKLNSHAKPEQKQLFYEPLQKKLMSETNIKHNDGLLRSDLDGTVLNTHFKNK